MNNDRRMVRQGDVLLLPVELEPGAGELLATGRVVLAEGEATGHAHVIADERVELRRQGGRRLLVNSAAHPVALVHEEHDPVLVQPGVWQVVRQREYRRQGTSWVVD